MSSGPAGCIMASPFQCMDAQEPVRATYVNPYGWPESDAEFVRSVSSGEHRRRRPHRHGQYHPHPGVVDSYSCRQIYLRSYTFSRKETVHERTRRYLGRVKGKVTVAVTGKGMLVLRTLLHIRQGTLLYVLRRTLLRRTPLRRTLRVWITPRTLPFSWPASFVEADAEAAVALAWLPSAAGLGRRGRKGV
ncbi:hypothetical protein Taro_026343 [Colocasia esculenta]|uniref:Uncharacterized protein n=1 Tax=Colocasia esculenta TaxID=4460 RepID=A0A843VGV4_COLES|nr:hypothetical protein [Colocasia esculenta]